MEVMCHAVHILDAKANINSVIDDMEHLSTTEKQQLKALLFKYKHLFNGIFGKWDTHPVHFELNKGAKQQLKALLFKYKHLFNGIFGKWDTHPVHFELKKGAKPFHVKPYLIPHVHEATLHKEVD